VSGEHWQGIASDWIDWARAPGHDAFWAYRDALRSFIPPPGRATLDLGCGEGRVARELTALGHLVTATDVSPSLLEAARQAGSARCYRARRRRAGHHRAAGTTAGRGPRIGHGAVDPASPVPVVQRASAVLTRRAAPVNR
jgi:SAM-dependent methyltransferase